MTALDDKNAFFDKMVESFDREYAIYEKKLNKSMVAFIKSGPHTYEETQVFIKGTGLDDIAKGFVKQYDGLLKHTKDLSAEIGIGFTLPKPAFNVMQLIKDNATQKVLGASNEIINTLTDASMRYGIGEVSLKTIVSELQSVITTAGRRITTEAFTGASMYDRSVKFMQYQQLDVKKYFYAGPVDKLNRDECADVLGSSLQSTGWTMADIDGSGVSFIGGGGYNCRHEFVPFVPGADALLAEMERDAGL